MFCVQESEDPLGDPFATEEGDPFGGVRSPSDSSEEEPLANRPAVTYEPNINLTVYQIPVYGQDKYKDSPYAKPSILQKRYSAPEPIRPYEAPQPKPMYDLTPVRYKKNGEIAKKRGPPKGYKRKPKVEQCSQMMNSSLTITPINTATPPPIPPNLPPGLTIIPHMSHKTLHPSPRQADPSLSPAMSVSPSLHHISPAMSANPALSDQVLKQALNVTQSLCHLTMVQKNAILSGLLMSNAMKMNEGVNINELLKQMGMPQFAVPSSLSITPELFQPMMPVAQKMPRLPKGVELVELDLDPADWFPSEPYRMSFSRKKHPKWKDFPHRCEHCFKGYRVASSLVSHAAERHGAAPRSLAIPCPCCPHVSVRRKQHRRHLAAHSVRRGKLLCLHCVPPQTPSEPFRPDTQRFPIDAHPQLYYASEESLRLHRKRKHPETAMFNAGWLGAWGDALPNS